MRSLVNKWTANDRAGREGNAFPHERSCSPSRGAQNRAVLAKHRADMIATAFRGGAIEEPVAGLDPLGHGAGNVIAASSRSSLQAVAAIVAAWQLLHMQRQSTTSFEDALAREYRELAATLPVSALLGESLSDGMHADKLDEFYRYFDLCNNQIFLHDSKRVSDATWRFSAPPSPSSSRER